MDLPNLQMHLMGMNPATAAVHSSDCGETGETGAAHVRLRCKRCTAVIVSSRAYSFGIFFNNLWSPCQPLKPWTSMPLHPFDGKRKGRENLSTTAPHCIFISDISVENEVVYSLSLFGCSNLNYGVAFGKCSPHRGCSFESDLDSFFWRCQEPPAGCDGLPETLLVRWVFAQPHCNCHNELLNHKHSNLITIVWQIQSQVGQQDSYTCIQGFELFKPACNVRPQESNGFWADRM